MRTRTALAATAALALGTVLAQAVSTKIEVTPPLTAAIEEVAAKGKVQCEPAEHWVVQGEAGAAAEFVSDEFGTRGWPLLDKGMMELSYVFIADPDPSDDRAIAVAGVLHERGADGESYVFLERCMTAQ
jgi:hypothetical protein